MAVVDRLPGMRPGKTGRNVAVAIGYFLLIGFVIVLLPFILAYAVVTNYRGSADRLSRLPGIDSGGGTRVAAAAFGYGILGWFIVGMAMGSGAPAEPVTADGVTPTEVEGAEQGAVVTTDSPTRTPLERTPTASTTSSPTPTASPTPTPSPTATPEPYLSGPEARDTFFNDLQVVIDNDYRVDYFVIDVSGDESTWTLIYEVGPSSEQDIMNQIAATAGAWSGFVDRDNIAPPDNRLEVSVENRNFEEIGTYHIETEWVEQYNDGELTDEEYLGLVFETLEATEGDG